ncbi:MAG: hypothetical protein AAGD14_16325 [Planctomycetota bacterium]
MRRLLVFALFVSIGVLWWLEFETGTPRTARERDPTTATRPAAQPDASTNGKAPAALQVFGRIVRKGSGEPISGAEVLFDSKYTVRTDARGEFTAPRRPGQDSGTFEIRHADHATLWSTRQLRNGVETFELPPALRVSGRIVMAETSRPVPGIGVRVGNRSTRTDANGRFETTDHPPGKLSVRSHNVSAEIEAGTRNFELGIAGPLLVVHTRDEWGQPLPGVRIDNAPTVFGDEACAHVIVAIDRNLGVQAVGRKEGYLPQRILFHAVRGPSDVYEKTVVLRALPPYAVTLQVSYADGASPDVVSATLEGAPGSIPITRRLPVKSGTVTLRNVPDGVFTLQVIGDRDDLLPFREQVTIAPHTKNRVRVELQRGARIEVQWEGKRRGSSLILRRDQWRDIRLRRPTGAFWSVDSGIPFGRYRLVELVGGLEVRGMDIDLRSPEPVRVDWREE